MKHPELAPERWDQHSRCKGPETEVPGAPGEGVGRTRPHGERGFTRWVTNRDPWLYAGDRST